jgi:hypothetical protein
VTAGTTCFLDPSTAGAYTSTEPTTTGQISTPIFVGDTASSAIMLTMRGTEIDSASTADFRVYRATSVQASAASTATKVQLNAETFDVDGSFDSTTNYRFTPTRAGKYVISGVVKILAMADQKAYLVSIYKNGVVHSSSQGWSPVAGANMAFCVTDTIDMNGSTDYIELYTSQFDSVSRNINYGSDETYMTGHFIGT